MIRELVKVSRVQSAPLNIIIGTSGYMMLSGEVISSTVGWMSLMILFGHMGMYSMNELADKEHDTAQNKVDKPLVNGSLEDVDVLTFTSLHMLISLMIAIIILQPQALALYIFSLMVAFDYNITNKVTLYSPVMMGVFASSLFLVGVAQYIPPVF